MAEDPTRPGSTGPLNITPAGIAIVLAALASVAVVSVMLTENLPHAVRPDAGDALGDTRGLLPHLVVVAATVAGFRRSGAVAALLVGAGGVLFAGVMVMLTLSSTYATFGALQLVLIVAAVVELRSRDSGLASAVQRLAGAIVAAVAWGVAYQDIRSANVDEQQRREYATASATIGRSIADTQERRSWMGREHLGALKALARCIEAYRGEKRGGPYPRSLAALAQWHDSAGRPYGHECGLRIDADSPAVAFLDPERHARVRYSPPRGRADPWRAGGFTLEVQAVWDSTDEPVSRGAPGTVSYLIDSAGRIRRTAEHRRATLVDDSLPRCPLAGYLPQCADYDPRQRWGLTYGNQVRGEVRPLQSRVLVDSTETFLLQFQPGAPTDSVAWYSIAWSEGERAVTTRVPASRAYPERVSNLVYEIPHRYREPGPHVIRATVATRGGERFHYRDTVNVLPRP